MVSGQMNKMCYVNNDEVRGTTDTKWWQDEPDETKNQNTCLQIIIVHQQYNFQQFPACKKRFAYKAWYSYIW